MFLSIVTTLYRSESYIEDFYARMHREATTVADDFEIIFVNDGSPDRSLEIVLRLSEHDPHVRLVDLSRNFGHHRAIMTGLGYARGELIFLIDSDLEEEPEYLHAFLQHMRATDVDVVYGVQDSRKGDAFERITGRIFYACYNLLSEYKIPPNLTVARLMTRRFVMALIQHRDRNLFLGGLCVITGFAQDTLRVRKTSKGSSAYSFSRKLSLALDSITSFSRKPLQGIFYLGLVMLLLSTVVGLYFVVQWVVLGNSVEGWTSLLVSVWWLGGLAIFSIGIVGIYVATVFVEVKDRPYAVIRGTYGKDELSSPAGLLPPSNVSFRQPQVPPYDIRSTADSAPEALGKALGSESGTSWW